MKYLIYSYPKEDGSIGEFKTTEEEAIKIQREYVFKKRGYVYETDQAALDDYICVNWAYWREEL